MAGAGERRKGALAGTALADVPLYGMVKDDHHRTRAIVDSDGREIAINMNRGTFTFITAIQDETHRFANAYRKQQMQQKSYSSTLTEIPASAPKPQSTDGAVQERDRREGSHARPAGKYPRRGQTDGTDHLRIFSRIKPSQSSLRDASSPERESFLHSDAMNVQS